MPQSEGLHTVNLYVRSLAAGDSRARIADVLSQLEELERTGPIDEYEVHVWGDGVCLDSAVTETTLGASMREQIAALREWATRTNCELTEFANWTRRSAISGEVHRYIVFPSMAL